MKPKIAVITATKSEDDFYPNLKALKEIANQRGMELDLLKNGEFQLITEQNSCTVLHRGTPFNLSDYQVVLNRLSVRDKSSADYYLINEFIKAKALVYNQPQNIELARNKLWTLQILSELNIPLTRSLVVRNHQDLYLAQKHFTFPVIIKNIFGSLGSSTLLAYDFAQLKSTFDYLWNVNRNEVLLIQEFVKTADNSISDIRVFMLGNRVAGVMQRTNNSGDFRANYAKGAEICAVDITDQEKKYCQKIVERFGLPIAGIDFIRTVDGPVFLEVNSNPGLDGIRTSMLARGVDILEEIISFCEEEFDIYQQQTNFALNNCGHNPKQPYIAWN